MFICLPQGIQDVGDFVSSVEHKRRFLTQTVAVCQSYNVSKWYSRLWEKKHTHRQNQIKPCGSWRYIEVLRHKTIGLCKKLNSIYITVLPLIHRNVQLSWARSQQPARDASKSGIVDAWAGLIWFCLCMFLFFFEFELKIFVCVLLKKQSHLHLGCPGGKQINIKFSFLGELSL